MGAGGAFSPPPRVHLELKMNYVLTTTTTTTKKRISFDVFEVFYAKLILP